MTSRTSAVRLHDGWCEMRFLSAGHYLRVNINYTQEGTQGLVPMLPADATASEPKQREREGNGQLSSTYCMQAQCLVLSCKLSHWKHKQSRDLKPEKDTEPWVKHSPHMLTPLASLGATTCEELCTPRVLHVDCSHLSTWSPENWRLAFTVGSKTRWGRLTRAGWGTESPRCWMQSCVLSWTSECCQVTEWCLPLVTL